MSDQEKSGLVIGHSIVSDHIFVKTFWNGAAYVTNIKHPHYHNGNLTLVGSYGKDFKKAGQEHEKWANFIRWAQQKEIIVPHKEQPKPVQQHLMHEEPKTIHVNAIKISMHTLLKILYNYLGSQELKVTPNRNYPSEVHMEIPHPNRTSGSCLYDFNRMEAWGITPKWYAIISEIKAEIQDRNNETIAEENANPGQCLQL